MSLARFAIAMVVFYVMGSTVGAADPFAVGKVWEGKRKAAPDDMNPFAIRLTITERKKDGAFKGEFLLINPANQNMNKIPATGFATFTDPGELIFDAEKGKLKHRYKGTLKNGQVGFKFTGTNPAGMPVSGFGTLNPK